MPTYHGTGKPIYGTSGKPLYGASTKPLYSRYVVGETPPRPPIRPPSDPPPDTPPYDPPPYDPYDPPPPYHPYDPYNPYDPYDPPPDDPYNPDDDDPYDTSYCMLKITISWSGSPDLDILVTLAGTGGYSGGSAGWRNSTNLGSIESGHSGMTYESNDNTTYGPEVVIFKVPYDITYTMGPREFTIGAGWYSAQAGGYTITATGCGATATLDIPSAPRSYPDPASAQHARLIFDPGTGTLQFTPL